MANTHILMMAALFLGAGASPAAQRTLTLDQATALALQSSYDLRTAKLELDASKSKVKEITAIGLPQVNASGNFTHNIDIATQVIPDFISPAMLGTLLQLGLITPEQAQTDEQFLQAQFGTKFSTTARISANQLLFDGTYLVGLQAARSYVGFSETMLSLSERDIKLVVRNSYYAALMAAENAKVLGRSKTVLEALTNDTDALIKAGFAEQTDKDRLSLSLSQLRSQIKLAESQSISALNMLKFQMGLPLTEQIALADSLEMHVDGAISDASTSAVFNPANTVEGRITDTNIILQSLLVRKEKSAYIPSLSAFFDHSQSALRNEFDFTDGDQDWFPSTYWGISLNVPILSSGMRMQKTAQAKIALQKAEILKEKTGQGLSLEFENMKSEYLFALENLMNAEESLALADKIHSRTGIKYKEGLAGSFELTETENQKLTSEALLLAAKLRLLNAKTQMDKLLNKI